MLEAILKLVGAISDGNGLMEKAINTYRELEKKRQTIEYYQNHYKIEDGEHDAKSITDTVTSLARVYGRTVASVAEAYSNIYAAGKRNQLTAEEVNQIFTNMLQVTANGNFTNEQFITYYSSISDILNQETITPLELKARLQKFIPSIGKTIDVATGFPSLQRVELRTKDLLLQISNTIPDSASVAEFTNSPKINYTDLEQTRIRLEQEYKEFLDQYQGQLSKEIIANPLLYRGTQHGGIAETVYSLQNKLRTINFLLAKHRMENTPEYALKNISVDEEFIPDESERISRFKSPKPGSLNMENRQESPRILDQILQFGVANFHRGISDKQGGNTSNWNKAEDIDWKQPWSQAEGANVDKLETVATLMEKKFDLRLIKLKRDLQSKIGKVPESILADYEKREMGQIERERFDAQLKEDHPYAYGIRSALDKFAENAGDVSSKVQSLFSGAFSKMGDEFVNFVKTGKFNFDDLVNTIVNGLINITVQSMVLKPMAEGLAKIIDMTFGNSGNPWGYTESNLLYGPTAHGNAFDSSGLIPFAQGGIVNRTTLFSFTRGLGVMGEAGPEAILPLRRTSGGDLGVKADGVGGGSHVQVNIFGAPPGTTTKEERGPNNQRVLQVLLGNSIAQDVAGGGAVARALESTYGLSRKGGY